MDTTPSNTPVPDPSAAPPASTPTIAPGGTNEGVSTITIDDFAKVQLRVGTVLEAVPHTKGNRLLVLQVDMGNGEKRQICAGIRQHVTVESIVGKQIVVVANLARREMMGTYSEGMLLAASDPSGKLTLVSPSEPIAPGAQVR